MLVVISDLHLQEIAVDRMGLNAMDGHSRNVSAEALNLLFEEIHNKVIEQDIEEIVLCLAGDIFEINRSNIWLEGEHRPYHRGLPPARLEPFVLRILDRIAQDNAEFLATLRGFILNKTYLYQGQARTIEGDVRVEVRYLTGNHDRLVDAWPSTRRRVRDILCLGGTDHPFEHEFLFANTTEQPGYGVLIRHGHEYDETNFAQTAPKNAKDSRYLYACLGDVITLEFVTYFPYRFRQLYEIFLAGSTKKSQFYQHLYAALLDFDDVRPASSLFAYLMSCLQSSTTKARELQSQERAIDLLRPILLEAFNVVARLKFVRKEAKSVMLRLVFLPPGRYLILAGLRWLPARFLGWGLNKVGVLRSRVEAVRPALFAAKEKELIAGRVHTVVAGHTHHPDQIPLLGGEQFFLDSGTWRTLIYQGEQDKVFGRLRAMTFIFCYRSDEGQTHRRFETWTGHLASARHKSFAAPVAEVFDEVS